MIGICSPNTEVRSPNEPYASTMINLLCSPFIFIQQSCTLNRVDYLADRDGYLESHLVSSNDDPDA